MIKETVGERARGLVAEEDDKARNLGSALFQPVCIPLSVTGE
jgi:hypothetical protein